MSATYSISEEGTKLLAVWENARTRCERAEADVQKAKEALRAAENVLGKWMVPSPVGDATACFGEQFNIWVGNGLLAARQVSETTYSVVWRKTPTGESVLR